MREKKKKMKPETLTNLQKVTVLQCKRSMSLDFVNLVRGSNLYSIMNLVIGLNFYSLYT